MSSNTIERVFHYFIFTRYLLQQCLFYLFLNCLRRRRFTRTKLLVSKTDKSITLDQAFYFLAIFCFDRFSVEFSIQQHCPVKIKSWVKILSYANTEHREANSSVSVFIAWNKNVASLKATLWILNRFRYKNIKSDWTFHSRRQWSAERLKPHAGFPFISEFWSSRTYRLSYPSTCNCYWFILVDLEKAKNVRLIKDYFFQGLNKHLLTSLLLF